MFCVWLPIHGRIILKSMCFDFHSANISNWNIIPDLIGKNNLTSTTSHGAIAASDTPAESVDNKGFFPFGIDGMFKGTAIILFAFIAFDAMVLSANDRNTAGSFNDSPNAKNNNNSKQQQQKQRRAKKNKSLPKTLIENFQKTLPASILSVNGMLFICMFGVSVALTLITPHYLLVTFCLFIYFLFWFFMQKICSLIKCLYFLMSHKHAA